MASTLFADVLTDQRLAEVVSQDYLLLAADRNALPNHAALVYGGDFAGSGAGMAGSPRKIPVLGFMGYDIPAAVAEGAAIIPGQITDQQVSVSVSRRGKAYQPSDEVRFTDSLGVFNTESFARDAVLSRDLALASIVANLVGGFGLSQSTTGVNLTVAVYLAAIGDLEVGSAGSAGPGNIMGILHHRQIGDLRDSFALSTAGAVQWSPVAASMLMAKQAGFVGNVMGVDLYSSGFVPTANAGADRAGGIFTTGGIVWADMAPSADSPSQVVLGGKTLYEHGRDPLSGLTAYISACWLGGTRGYDTAPNQLGVSIVTDA